MKFLVVSDAHGNRFGLEATLNCGRDFDEIICLGDIVGYGAHPNQCCEMLRERGAICLSGNHDAAALGKISIEWFNPIAAEAILWTRAQLSPQNCAWLDTLPAQLIFENWGFQTVHASLREPWEEYITDTKIAEPNLMLMTQPLCFFGHTHQAVCAAAPRDLSVWRRPDQLQWVELPMGGAIELENGELTLVNPGSCGQPRDGNPLAKAAIFDNQTQKIEVFGVEYDIEAARAAILAAGLPARLGDRLLVGH